MSNDPRSATVLEVSPPAPSAEPPPLPAHVDLNVLQRASSDELAAWAVRLGVRNQPPRTRRALVCELVRAAFARACR